MNAMEEAKAIRLKAGQRAIEKLIEEHRKSGEPMVISPEPDLIQWVVPQDDGTMKVVKERRLSKTHSRNE
ncbi:MAG TPA: hypothetical protein VFH95_15025 [Candidatus Kapabacteria bacterium]|nr:hypothetical protein [Candidatus Kapabacteria bacterium]